MSYILEIQKIRLEINENYNDIEYSVGLLKRAITIADRNNDLEWGVDLRIDLLDAEYYTSSSIESVSAFTWILDVCDKYPEQFEEAEFLILYDRVFEICCNNSSLTKEQIQLIGDDLLSRLERNDMSKRGYYFTLLTYAERRGEFDQGKEYLELAFKEAYDEDNTEFMESILHVEFLLLTKSFDEAIAIYEKLAIVYKEKTYLLFQSCCAICYCLVRSNDARAELYFQKVIKRFGEEETLDSNIFFCMNRFMYILYVYNDNLLWDVFQKISGWEIDANDYLHLMFYKHASVICYKGGTKELQLPIKVPYCESGGIYDLSKLYVYFDKEATRLAYQFDTRNGNDYCMNDYLELKEMNGIKA